MCGFSSASVVIIICLEAVLAEFNTEVISVDLVVTHVWWLFFVLNT